MRSKFALNANALDGELVLVLVMMVIRVKERERISTILQTSTQQSTEA